MARIITKRYTTGEEILNAVTHGIGTLLSIAALVLLILRAVYYAPEEYRVRCIVGFSIFGSSLIILYLFSTLYHALPLGAKTVFGIFDHCSIYILIAGTYIQYFLHNQKNITLDGLLSQLREQMSDYNSCKTYHRLKNNHIKYLVIDPNIGTV